MTALDRPHNRAGFHEANKTTTRRDSTPRTSGYVDTAQDLASYPLTGTRDVCTDLLSAEKRELAMENGCRRTTQSPPVRRSVRHNASWIAPLSLRQCDEHCTVGLRLVVPVSAGSALSPRFVDLYCSWR